MKKSYQIQKGQALWRFEQAVAEQQPVLQLVLPIAALGEQMHSGLMQLAKRLSVGCLEQMMAWEVEQLTGPRHHPSSERNSYRWGSERGYCVLGGQKVAVNRPRVRDLRRREVSLGSYEMIQQASLHDLAVWDKIMHGLTMRRYSAVVKQFAEAYGITKSSVSRHFVEASRGALHKISRRQFHDHQFCAMLLDGQYFRSREVVVCLGITSGGQKMVLGLRQGATENATVVQQLLEDIAERGVDLQAPRLYVIDGSKALAKAIRRLCGPAAIIQRCQAHKLRNVLDHLIEEHQTYVRQRLSAAWATLEQVDAERALQRLHRELMDLNPSAAHSLEEGMQETITLHRLRLPRRLRRSFATTNLIESSFSMVDTICRNVKRWWGGDQLLRWVASALLYSETRWNRVQGYHEIPLLLKELELAALAPALRRSVMSA